MKLSVILPAREEPFLQRTVDDLLAQAAGDVEIIAVLDGGSATVRPHPQVRTVGWSTPRGLRASINAGMAIATGDFLMKIDAHCAVAHGYDVALASRCDQDMIVVPAKYSLEPETWTPHKDPWLYFYLTFPWGLGENHIGLQDKAHDKHYNAARAHIQPTDDIISFQGSCWFMSRTHWTRIGPMDAERYYYAQEPQEIGLRTWLGGGSVKIVKDTWYAHLHKGNSHKRGFPRFKGQWRRAHEWSADYWMHDRWPERVHDMRWLIERFLPMPGWPADWDDPKHEAARKAQDALVPA